MAKEVMPFQRIWSTSCLFWPGQRKEMRVVPSLMWLISWSPRVGFSWGGRILSTTSAEKASWAVPILAPALMQSWSEMEAPLPAPDSTRKLAPFFLMTRWMVSGVMATLASFWCTSLGTPTTNFLASTPKAYLWPLMEAKPVSFLANIFNLLDRSTNRSNKINIIHNQIIFTLFPILKKMSHDSLEQYLARSCGSLLRNANFKPSSKVLRAVSTPPPLLITRLRWMRWIWKAEWGTESLEEALLSTFFFKFWLCPIEQAGTWCLNCTVCISFFRRKDSSTSGAPPFFGLAGLLLTILASSCRQTDGIVDFIFSDSLSVIFWSPQYILVTGLANLFQKWVIGVSYSTILLSCSSELSGSRSSPSMKKPLMSLSVPLNLSPSPFCLSNSQFPLQKLPSYQYISPYPLRMLSLQLPLQMFPHAQVQIPQPFFLLFLNSPSYLSLAPLPPFQIPWPLRRPLLKCPLQYCPFSQKNSPNPSNLPSLKWPLQRSPFLKCSIPSPFLTKLRKSPSYLLPCESVKTPKPLACPSLHSPMQVSPFQFFHMPLPCFRLLLHSPSQACPLGQQYFPCPCILPFSYSPSQMQPLLNFSNPCPWRRSFFQRPSQAWPLLQTMMPMPSRLFSRYSPQQTASLYFLRRRWGERWRAARSTLSERQALKWWCSSSQVLRQLQVDVITDTFTDSYRCSSGQTSNGWASCSTSAYFIIKNNILTNLAHPTKPNHLQNINRHSFTILLQMMQAVSFSSSFFYYSGSLNSL